MRLVEVAFSSWGSMGGLLVVPASESIKFNSPAAISNFFGASATILSAPSLVSDDVDVSADSTIVENILNASASGAAIFRDSSSVVAVTISTTPWMIQLAAPASDSINFNSSDAISNLFCASIDVLGAPSRFSVGRGKDRATSVT